MCLNIGGGEDRKQKEVTKWEQEALKLWSRRLRNFRAGGSGILEQEAPKFQSRRLQNFGAGSSEIWSRRLKFCAVGSMIWSRMLHYFEQKAPGSRAVGSFGVYVYYSPEKYVENIIIIFSTFLRDRMLNLLLRMLIANQQHICWGDLSCT